MVEVRQELAGRVGRHPAVFAPDQSGDMVWSPAFGQLGQGLLAFPQAKIVDGRKVLQEGSADGGDVHPAENGPDFGLPLLYRFGQGIAVQKTGGRSGESHKIRPPFEDLFYDGVSGRQPVPPQTIIDMHLMSPLLQPGRHREQAEGGHAIGDGREIGLAGDPVGARRMDQKNSHGRCGILMVRPRFPASV